MGTFVVGHGPSQSNWPQSQVEPVLFRACDARSITALSLRGIPACTHAATRSTTVGADCPRAAAAGTDSTASQSTSQAECRDWTGVPAPLATKGQPTVAAVATPPQ